MPIDHDSDSHKGAVESESPADAKHRPDLRSNLADQLPHRSVDPSLDPLIKDADTDNDTDFPEPGRAPEHSGQHR